MGQQAAAGFHQLYTPPSGGSFSPSDVPVYWEWDGTQASWSTTTGTSQTQGSSYLVSAPNLGNSGAGTFTFNTGTYNPASGQGWIVADSLEGIKLYGAETSWKAPMTNGTDTSFYATKDRDYLMFYVVTWGGSSSADTFKRNNGSHHKFSGNSETECTEIWHSNSTGTGTVHSNTKVNAAWGTTLTSGNKYLLAFARGFGTILTTDEPTVPGTYSDGGKCKIWICPLASTWSSVAKSDTLKESINDATDTPVQPAYIVKSNSYNHSDTTTEHYLNESSVLHAYGYLHTYSSESQIETLLESVFDYAKTQWG